jgi:hypothetical protein
MQAMQTSIYITLIILIDIDWKRFEEECKKIVKDIQDKFIDLGLDDHESDFAAGELQAKQERFEREFKRMPFEFAANSLQLPASKGVDEEAIEEQNDTARQADDLGLQLEALSEILHGGYRTRLR